MRYGAQCSNAAMRLMKEFPVEGLLMLWDVWSQCGIKRYQGHCHACAPSGHIAMGKQAKQSNRYSIIIRGIEGRDHMLFWRSKSKDVCMNRTHYDNKNWLESAGNMTWHIENTRRKARESPILFCPKAANSGCSGKQGPRDGATPMNASSRISAFMIAFCCK